MRTVAVVFMFATAVQAEEVKNYTIETVVPQALRVGAESVTKLILLPKAPYHTNKDYPTRLKIAAPKELGVTKSEQRLADAKAFSPERLEFHVPVMATKSGVYEMLFDFKSAVCTNETCIPLKENLTLKLTVQN